MKTRLNRLCALFWVLILPAALHAADRTNRIIVKLEAPLTDTRLEELSVQAGMALRHQRRTATGAEVLRLPRQVGQAQARALARRLSRLPGVVYAEPSLRRHARAPISLPPNDPYYNSYQWALHDKASEPASANLPDAWTIAHGSADLRIAVLDSGYLPHPELLGRTLPREGAAFPYGYDFIDGHPEDPEPFFTANDGDGRDADPTDPGDGIRPGEVTPDCPADNSSWHGLTVAGVIAATTNNDEGIAGIDHDSRLLPVRVLGRCGGFTDDIADAIIWAAGGTVDGVPDNAYPARVISLSLGNPESCTRLEQESIDIARGLGAVIVAAAGNDGAAHIDAPASCDGVIAVTASGRDGLPASYTNHGPEADIAAPGGGDNDEGIITLFNGGAITVGNYDYAYISGTSIAVPHVSGVVALMLAANHARRLELDPGTENGWLAPARIEEKLLATARPFADLATCTDCGAGIVDAAAAVRAVSTPPVVTPDPSSLSGPQGTELTLAAKATDDGATLDYQWSQTDDSGYDVALTGATRASATLVVPGAPAGTELRFRVRVTDDVGLHADGEVIVTVNNGAPVFTPVRDQDLTVNRAFSLTLTASDPEGYILSATNLPQGARFDPDTGVFEWTPAETGRFEVSFLATDGADPALVSQQDVVLTVSRPASGGGGAPGWLLWFSLPFACARPRTGRRRPARR